MKKVQVLLALQRYDYFLIWANSVTLSYFVFYLAISINMLCIFALYG